MEKIKTTPSQENYIEHIYRLSEHGPVRQSMLSKKLGIQRSSINRFIGTLVKDGFVEGDDSGDIVLTDKGITVARAIIRRDDCLTRFLVDVCAMTPEHADPEVHRLEHVLSDAVLTRLEVLVDFASSSDAWLKRLHYRIGELHEKDKGQGSTDVGTSATHPGMPHEKY